jgi:hypothetical protein
MLTTLSKPQSMSLGLPDKDPNKDNVDMKVDENRTMTVLLGIMARSFIMLVCWLLHLRVLRTLLLVKTVFVKNCFLGNKSSTSILQQGKPKTD